MMQAWIVEIKARGAKVLLENNEIAWLPGQEISTQYDPSRKLYDQDICKKEQCLDVVVYGKAFGGKQKLVSHIRFSNDPWQKVGTWQDNDAKEMEINSVAGNRAYGFIESGVQGFMILDDIYNNIPFPRSWNHFKTICAGDIIAGFVKTGEIDQQSRLVKLAPTGYIKKLMDIPGFLPILQNGTDAGAGAKGAGTVEKRVWKNHMSPGIRYILVVDDDHLFLKEMGDYLESCGIKTTRAKSLDGVNGFLENPGCPDMDIALVDINLTAEHDYLGFKTAETIAQLQPRCCIIMTTGDSIDINKISASACNVSVSGFLYKPFGIEEWNQVLSSAMQENPRKMSDFFKSAPREAEIPLPIIPGIRTVRKLVSDLKNEIEAEVVSLFSIHPLSYEIRIEAYSGVMRERINEYLGKLRYSPVKDVAIDKEIIFDCKVTDTPRYSKHRWLVTALRYESCIGFPVPVTGELEYCLFAFHGNKNHFDKMGSYKVKSTAAHIAQALEIQRLEETIRTENPFYLAGKTYGSMAHDLANALNREFGISTLLKSIDCQAVITGDDKIKIMEKLGHIGAEVRRAREIVNTFRRMSRSQHETEIEVNVPEILQKVSETIKVETDALNIDIKLKIPREVTTIPGIVKIKQTPFEQVLYNLFLNAAQQIKRFSFARGKGYILAECASVNDDEGKAFLRVLIHDSGPGIHGRDFEKVFEKGFTTKEDGSGMGLDICRNIVNQAGGKIKVLKSILFCGTTFEILLPFHQKEV